MRMIREARHEDIPQMVALGEVFYQGTILKDYAPYDPQTIFELIRAFINGPNGTVIVYEVNGEVVGGLIGCCVPLYWNKNLKTCQQVAWFVHPEHRNPYAFKMLDRFMEWAKEQGAVIVFSGAKDDAAGPTMRKMMKRKGFQSLESVHIAEVKQCQQQ